MPEHTPTIYATCQEVQRSLETRNPANARPTGVGVLYHPRTDEVLLIQPKKSDEPIWKFVQGGLDGQPVVPGVLREIGEELSGDYVAATRALHGLPGEVLTGGQPRDGKAMKSYYPLVAILDRKPPVEFDRREVAAARWHAADRAGRLIFDSLHAKTLKELQVRRLDVQTERSLHQDPTFVIFSRFAAVKSLLRRAHA